MARGDVEGLISTFESRLATHDYNPPITALRGQIFVEGVPSDALHKVRMVLDLVYARACPRTRNTHQPGSFQMIDLDETRHR